MTKQQRHDQEEARKQLRDLLVPGERLNLILRHCSRSGMMREISVLHGGRDISYLVAPAIDHKRGNHAGGVKIHGCGSDMGFEIVYLLGRALFPNGFGLPCQSEGCQFRPHSKEDAISCNLHLPAGVSPHIFQGRNGDKSGWDNDGGYAFRMSWI